MKDLITAMAGVMILMVFVLQFANNQIICSRIAIADKAVQNFQGSYEEGDWDTEKEKLRAELSSCFNCQSSRIDIAEKEKTAVIEVPIENVIACGTFLGIEDEDNVILYRNKVWKE